MVNDWPKWTLDEWKERDRLVAELAPFDGCDSREMWHRVMERGIIRALIETGNL